eukprot:CAMPEP_0182585354 /NCGR_PEP_ID=MMETSP1324-20130603/60138_1 /TAXON_ID=236786 /ORGANISM="Florenciella sp., Strain RCC1587" /LENGTH=85 /DNA_ID=CAMNT_0024802149 /DNA_START=506 /DNA_END=759 /DNA_ORIENTATION=+
MAAASSIICPLSSAAFMLASGVLFGFLSIARWRGTRLFSTTRCTGLPFTPSPTSALRSIISAYSVVAGTSVNSFACTIAGAAAAA